MQINEVGPLPNAIHRNLKMDKQSKCKIETYKNCGRKHRHKSLHSWIRQLLDMISKGHASKEKTNMASSYLKPFVL